jgi:hypothetical protein
MLENSGNTMAGERRLVAQLDQMNAYLVLMTPLLPEPYPSEWKHSLQVIARLMIERFYSPEQNLFFLSANRPEDLDLAKSATDFGHTIKAFWMIRFTGRLTGDAGLVEFAERNGRRVLERAYLAESGSWASGVKAGGALDIDKSWWIYAELDQFAASLAMTDPAMERYLGATYAYWLDRFVDKRFGEVWTTVDGVTHLPKAGELPKAWPWKNGYHSTEHALVAYLQAMQREGRAVELYFAFQGTPSGLRPYLFEGDYAGWEDFGDGRHRVTFVNVR